MRLQNQSDVMIHIGHESGMLKDISNPCVVAELFVAQMSSNSTLPRALISGRPSYLNVLKKLVPPTPVQNWDDGKDEAGLI